MQFKYAFSFAAITAFFAACDSTVTNINDDAKIDAIHVAMPSGEKVESESLDVMILPGQFKYRRCAKRDRRPFFSGFPVDLKCQRQRASDCKL